MATKAKILLIDDDSAFLDEAKTALSANGFEVLTAGCKKDALDNLDKFHPAVAILDKKLPDVDGQDLIKDLKLVSSDTEIIILTAYGSIDSAVQGFKAGISDYIVKPASFNNIAKIIEEAIETKKLRKAPQQNLPPQTTYPDPTQPQDLTQPENQKFFQGIFNDLRKQNELELKLIESETKIELLSQISDEINESLIVCDSSKKIVYCNKTTEDLFGHKSNELIGQNLSILFSDLTSPSLYENLLSAAPRENSHESEFMCITKHETTFPARIRIHSIKDSTGKLQKIICRIANTTEKNILENELRRQNQKLEIAIRNKTADMQKTMIELQEVNNKLQQYDALKSKFVSYVAHEIKNPLFIIQASISNILDGLTGDINERTRKNLEICKKETDRLLNFTKETLDLSKIDAGKLPIRRTLIKISDLIKEVALFVMPEFEKNHIKLTYNTENAPKAIWADENLLKQILINLLRNALKYTPKEKSVKLSLFEKDDKLNIEVQDEGFGIPKDKINKIFDRFYRVDEELKEGTGIGLAITKEIVSLHSGEIWANSEMGKGSTFHIVLPVDLRKGLARSRVH